MSIGQWTFVTTLLLAYVLTARALLRNDQRDERATRERRRNHRQTLISRREWP